VKGSEVGEETRPLKIGLYLPASEYTMAGKTARWKDYMTLAQFAESAGFDSVWTSDHLLFRTHETKGAWECWSLLSALAAVTSRVEIGPLVACMGFRNPALLAKMAETVDEISGGRLILGIGAGWHEPEYDAFGFPFDHRFSRFEEGLKIITGLLRDGQSNVEGTFFQTQDCVLRPRGPRASGPPVMIGTFGKKMLRLTARHADIWNADWSRRYEEIATHVDELERACNEVGREPSTLERTACILVEVDGAAGRGSSSQSRNESPRPMSTDEIVDVIGAYVENGFTHLIIWVDPNTPDGIDRFLPVLEQLDRAT
jgi:probable F420-dependent oxidoreductase